MNVHTFECIHVSGVLLSAMKGEGYEARPIGERAAGAVRAALSAAGAALCKVNNCEHLKDFRMKSCISCIKMVVGITRFSCC